MVPAPGPPGEGVPLVSVVIPTLNEEADIETCIDAVGHQTHPADHIELIVVDGCSEDGTVDRVRRATQRYSFRDVAVVENPVRRTSAGLNRGLERAHGAYLVRVDARSRIPEDYIEVSIGILAEHREIGVVGGAQAAQPRSERLVDVAIARALRNRWSTGLSRYRRSSISQPSDTVWMGVFRPDELRKLGGWAEDVALNEDYDLNSRYRSSGMVVWFQADLRSGYVPRASVLGVAKQYYRFGMVKGISWARGGRPSPRQLFLLALPIGAGAATFGAARRLGGWKAVALPPGALVLVDALGNAGPPVPLGGRLYAAGVIGVYVTSWWTGVWHGLVRDWTVMRRPDG